jgi:hypothetical protein
LKKLSYAVNNWTPRESIHGIYIERTDETELDLTMVTARVMVFNTTFNNISVILWRSILLVEFFFELTTLVVIGTDCICCYKSN